MAFSGCKTFRLEQYHPAKVSISRYSLLAVSWYETLKYGQCCPAMNWNCCAQESRFQATKRSVICSTVIKGPRFGGPHKQCFEAWKCSHIDCSALLFGGFANSQESRFQDSKRSNMCCAALGSDCSADIYDFCFQDAKRSDMDCFELNGGLFDDCQPPKHG